MQLVAEGKGWVLTDERLVWTNDGGESWTEIEIPEAAARERSGVFFLDRQHGWLSLVAPGAQGLDSPSIVSLYRTNDGGQTWQESSFEGPPIPIGYAGPPWFRGVFRFVDTTNGWFDGTGGSGTQTAPRLYQTQDGGKTWVELPGAPGAGFGHDSWFVTRTEGWITEIDGGLFRTRDGGASWQPVRLPFPAGCEERGAHYFDAPVFPASVDGVLPVREKCNGLDGTIFYAGEDGGAAWHVAAVRPGAYATQIITPSVWLDVREGELFKTNDAGAHWTQITPDWSAMFPGRKRFILFDVQFANERYGWAMLQHDSLTTMDMHHAFVATADGGHTWVALHP